MIHARVTRSPEGTLDGIHISVTAESLPNFESLINRGLNCWDSAPAELKELGDMLTHGRVTQNHAYTPINTKQNLDYYTPEEYAKISDWIETHGRQDFLHAIRTNQVGKILSGKEVSF